MNLLLTLFLLFRKKKVWNWSERKYSLAESDCDAGRCCWDGRPREGWASDDRGSDERDLLSWPLVGVDEVEYVFQSDWNLKRFHLRKGFWKLFKAFYLHAERRIVMRIFNLINKVCCRCKTLEVWKLSTPRRHKFVVLSIHWPHNLLLIQARTHAWQIWWHSSSRLRRRRWKVPCVGAEKT